MKMKIAAGLFLAAGLGLAVSQEGSADSPAPEVWVHEGDRDGDGLSDAFEEAHGLEGGQFKG